MTVAAPPVRIIILNYNGRELLPLCLPGIVKAAAKSSFPVTVAILDNLSTDDGLDYVRREFPGVFIERAPENRILCSYNEYLPRISEPVVIFLNNDIRVDENFIDPLVKKLLESPQNFMTAPKVISFDGKTLEAGRTEAKLKWGIFWASARFPGFENQAETPSETFSSGFGALSRKKFLELGGYDDRFAPGIFEDIDLSWRARKKGWKLYYEPRSVVYHMGQASFKKKFGEKKIRVLAHRNNFLFLWKNYSGPAFWAQHILFLPLRFLFSGTKGDWTLFHGFIEACRLKSKKKGRSCCPSA